MLQSTHSACHDTGPCCSEAAWPPLPRGSQHGGPGCAKHHTRSPGGVHASRGAWALTLQLLLVILVYIHISHIYIYTYPDTHTCLHPFLHPCPHVYFCRLEAGQGAAFDSLERYYRESQARPEVMRRRDAKASFALSRYYAPRPGVWGSTWSYLSTLRIYPIYLSIYPVFLPC